MYLKPEDYQEPACLLCMDHTNDKQIPVMRIIEKLDAFLNRNDYSSAELLLTKWLDEAKNCRDKKGQLSLYNERMGLFRKLSKKDDAISDANTALHLVEELDVSQMKTAGTTYLNAATVFKAFGQAKEALPLYEKALAVYTACLSPTDAQFGGLYNNMALALVDLHQFDRADDYYRKALIVMSQVENGELDQAITYLNMADAAVAQYGAQQAEQTVHENIETATRLLDTPSLERNGYYAFVAEKCAPTFRYYGYFAYARELEERSRRIYEGT